MKNNSLINVKGLKCDNPNCAYENMSIKLEDYKKYINYPCPCCKNPLLTLEDYNNVKRLVYFSKFSELLGIKQPSEKISIEMNGTGKMKFKKNNKR